MMLRLVSHCQTTLSTYLHLSTASPQRTGHFPTGVHGRVEELTGQALYETPAFQYIWFNKQHDESIKRTRFKVGLGKC
jgi:hypothetical protein